MKRSLLCLVCVVLVSVMTSIFVEGPASGQIQVQGPKPPVNTEFTWPPSPESSITLSGVIAPQSEYHIEQVFTVPTRHWLVVNTASNQMRADLIEIVGGIETIKYSRALEPLQDLTVGIAFSPNSVVALGVEAQQAGAWSMTGYLYAEIQNHPRWPPRPDQIVNASGYFPQLSDTMSPSVIYTVPADKWFILTTLQGGNGELSLFELLSGQATLKAGVADQLTNLDVGVAFPPGSQIALKRLVGTSIKVYWQLVGYLADA